MFVVSGPSGVGKGTIVKRLLEVRPDLSLSVSCTTRPPRRGEVDGREYRFVSPRTFRHLVQDGAFLEWAEVFGHRYGTLAGPIAEDLERGRDVLLEIDVQGARNVRDRVPEAILIFVEPPSEAELERRLRARRTESDPQLAERLAAARRELADAGWFDHRVINDDLQRAADEVAAILDAHRDHG